MLELVCVLTLHEAQVFHYCTWFLFPTCQNRAFDKISQRNKPNFEQTLFHSLYKLFEARMWSFAPEKEDTRTLHQSETNIHCSMTSQPLFIVFHVGYPLVIWQKTTFFPQNLIENVLKCWTLNAGFKVQIFIEFLKDKLLILCSFHKEISKRKTIKHH